MSSAQNAFPLTVWPVLIKICLLTDHRGIQPCYPWLGSLTGKGYPQLRMYGVTIPVHRVIYAVTHAVEPGALMVRHLCNNTWCCNPNHLAQGTAVDNSQDAVSAGRHAHGKRSGVRKLLESEAAAIRDEYTTGSCQRYLAIKYGVAQKTVRDIVTGKTWVSFGGAVVRQREPSAEEAKQQSASLPRPHVRRERIQGSEVLTFLDVAQIKLLRGNGVRRSLIAEQFAVSVATITSIDEGRLHAGIDGPPPRDARLADPKPRRTLRPWERLTDADAVNIRESYAGGERMQRIAVRYGVGTTMVDSILSGKRFSHIGGRVERPLKVAEALTDADARSIRDDYSAGMSFVAIGRLHGIGHTLARQITLGERFKHLGGPACREVGFIQARVNGSSNGASKLTAAKVAEMRMLRSTGWTFGDLAEVFKVAKSTARRAVRGRNWSHVPSDAGQCLSPHEEKREEIVMTAKD